MSDYLDAIPDAELLHEWGIGAYGFTAAELAPVAEAIRRVHRRERKWLEQEAGLEPPDPPDLLAQNHMRRMRGDRR